jgi:hypothetical protein
MGIVISEILSASLKRVNTWLHAIFRFVYIVFIRYSGYLIYLRSFPSSIIRTHLQKWLELVLEIVGLLVVRLSRSGLAVSPKR